MRLHLACLGEAEVHLICVPHTLDPVGVIPGIKHVNTFTSPFLKPGSFLNIIQIRECQKRISLACSFTESDILIMYTEFEVINQFIAHLVKKANGKVFVLDEGLGTYLTYSQKCETGVPAKQIFKLLWSKHILGYSWLKHLYIDGIISPQMSDSMIDGLISYQQFDCIRNVPVKLINKPILKQLILNDNSCVFLNSDNYNFYTTWDCYISELVVIMEHLCKHFKEVYFKFHPREHSDIKNKIESALSSFSNLIIIDGIQPIETTIESIRTKYAVSYVSTSLLNLIELGVQPIYIFHLMQSTSSHKVATSLKPIIQSMGIRLVESLDEISAGEQYYAHNIDSEVRLTFTQAIGV
jgi:hypothetical protein